MKLLNPFILQRRFRRCVKNFWMDLHSCYIE